MCKVSRCIHGVKLTTTRWAIRNCGMMLFRALLIRLNPGSGSRSTKGLESYRRFSKATYQKFPKLAELVIRLLKETHNTDGYDPRLTESRQVGFAFAAMAIIETVGVSSTHRDNVRTFLLGQLGNPDWRLREKGARTLGLLMNEDDMIKEIKELVERKTYSQNELHGRLLCLVYLIDRSEHEPFGEIPPYMLFRLCSRLSLGTSTRKLEQLLSILGEMMGNRLSFFNTSTYLETITRYIKGARSHNGTSCLGCEALAHLIQSIYP